MRQSVACLTSAVIAAVATTWLLANPGMPREAQAAQQRPVAAGPRPPAAFNQEGLTPDESVAVRVYERNNRSVANITTRIRRGGGLFGFESTAEDAG